MNVYIFMLSILSMTAFAGLMVGVANDAVNFLNSAIGSRVAKRNTIMIVAAIGAVEPGASKNWPLMLSGPVNENAPFLSGRKCWRMWPVPFSVKLKSPLTSLS